MQRREQTVALESKVDRHDDGRLAEACRRGDGRAFDELVHRYKDRVFAVVYRFLGDREEALDISQEVFVNAYRGIAGFRGSSRLYTWLYSIAANLARNRLRDMGRRGRGVTTSFEALQQEAPAAVESRRVDAHTPREAVMTAELESTLQRCLNELPEHYRLAFVLRTSEDLSYDEIAEIMGCPVNTVKSRLNMARQRLRDRLRELELI